MNKPKASVDISTMFVDDDDAIHMVIYEHESARPIAARLEMIKEMKKAQQV